MIEHTPRTYGIDEHIIHYGNGENLYRSEDFAQSRALKVDDVLSTGMVVSRAETGFNSSVVINGWLNLAPRLPIKLASEIPGVRPQDLQVGDILETGDVILDNPSEPELDRFGCEVVEVLMSGGLNGHEVKIPTGIELAVANEKYDPNSTSKLGSFAASKLVRLSDKTLQKVTCFAASRLGDKGEL